jgi:hypothetical protein
MTASSKSLIGCFLIAACAPLQAELLDNGDLSKGAATWKGDRKVVDDPADATNKVIVVDVQKNRPVSFFQPIDTRGVNSFTVTFQMKTSDDYKGNGFTLRISRPDGNHTFHDYGVTARGSWRKFSWPFNDLRGNNKVTFTVECKEGVGKLYFDDFSIAEPKPTPAATP